MPKNNLQILFNRLEKEAQESEAHFLAAEKERYALYENYTLLKSTLQEMKGKLGTYPQAYLQKRLALIETLVNHLMLNHDTTRRTFNALGFLLSRARHNLAQEMLEPKLYQKIRSALEEEESLKVLRKKYPESDAIVKVSRPIQKKRESKPIRLLLIGVSGLYFALPVDKVLKRFKPGVFEEALRQRGYSHFALPIQSSAPTLAVAFLTPNGSRRTVYCDEYFTPVEISQRELRKRVTWSSAEQSLGHEFRPQIQFYGRRFFVYGARLSYTVRTGDASRPS